MRDYSATRRAMLPRVAPNALVIPLSRGGFALVDAGDFDLVRSLPWHAINAPQGRRYAVHRRRVHGKNTCIYMHRFIMRDRHRQIDHRNGNGLDNRKSNLRAATHSENQQNSSRRSPRKTSRYKGVFWNSQKRKWQARVCRLGGRQIHLGFFKVEVEAARAYDAAARRHYGEFARTNDA